MSDSEPQSHSDTPLKPTAADTRSNSGLRFSFVDILGWVITAFWGASFILEATSDTYDPPASIHPLMMMVAGAAFGSTILKDRNHKKANEEDEK